VRTNAPLRVPTSTRTPLICHSQLGAVLRVGNQACDWETKSRPLLERSLKENENGFLVEAAPSRCSSRYWERTSGLDATHARRARGRRARTAAELRAPPLAN